MTLHVPDFLPMNGVDLSEAPRSGTRGFYAQRVKRALDILFVLASAPFTVPVVLILAAIVALDGHNPFYSQRRVGRGGRIFRMWKLRTMVPDADEMLANCLERDQALRTEWECHQKLRRDPRITAIGRILRKTSIDELPQFWNVLRGDMSVVGPRPMMDAQSALYPGTSYYLMRPGVTGPWQVSDRHATSFAERARFDDLYAGEMSILSDLRLLWQTVAVMMRGTGC